jgi:hypothetical protein
MKRGVVLVASVLVLVAGAAVWWWHGTSHPIDIRASDVASVRIEPVPEGPVFPVFDLSRSAGSRPLGLILDDIPIPLPAPGVQPIGCGGGGNLIVTLRDGTVVTYGPCRHPASVRHLWSRMMTIETDGRCEPSCAPPS